MKNWQRLLGTGILALTSILSMASTASAVKLKVSIENLAPNRGITLAQAWFSFHNGSFDLFDEGGSASPQLSLLAEDGLIGLEAGIPGLIEDAFAAGLNISGLPLDIQAAIQTAIALGIDPSIFLSTLPPPGSTIGGLFNQSAASLNGGTQGLVYADTRDPFYLLQAPGVTVSTIVDIEQNNLQNNRFFSYAAMLFPTNDGFIANDNPTAIEIFDAQGRFIGADIVVLGNQAFDAGTEFNDETPANVPYSLSVFGIGISENETIRLHPGFQAPGQGGILDFELNGETIFENADFTAPSYQIARITITAVPSPEPSATIGLILGSTILLLLRRVIQ